MGQAPPVRSKQDYFIKFNPTINNHFGHGKSSIIIDRLEYWFARSEYKFYKFLEPCEHALYKVGDSWLEETGIKRKTFKTVFKLFGTWYNSKSEFLKQDDPFQGKLYSAYYDRKLNQTFFVRNDALVKSFSIKLKAKLFPTTNNSIKKQGYKDKVGEQTAFNYRSRNGKNYQSFPHVDNIYNKLNNNINNKQIITSSSNIVDVSDLETEQQQILTTQIKKEKDYKKIEKLKTIWLEEVGEFKDTGKSKYIAKQLLHAFNYYFEANYDLFRQYCRKISSSRFLMGEVTSFKARIDWLLQSSTIQKIQNGDFSTGDRVTLHEQNQQQQTKQKLQKQEQQDITALSEQAEQNNFDGNIAKTRLFIINRFGYGCYLSWFKDAKFEIIASKLTIHGKTAFATDFIENNYLFQINNYIKKLMHKS